MPAAMAAFNDSTPTVGMETGAAAGRHTAETPWASLPTIKAQRPVRSVAASGRGEVAEAAGMAANRAIRLPSSAARAAAESRPGREGTRNSEPAEARSALGLWGLT